MSDDWLDIADENIDVQEIMRRIRERIAQQEGVAVDETDPAIIAADLWKEMIGNPTDDSLTGRIAAIRPRDCDIVPRDYVIDWRMPILGPIHAVVRRVINAEIRRYLTPSLGKQSSLNRQLLQMIKDLAQENAELRQKLGEQER